VTLTKPLCVSKYEVTQAEWQLIMGRNTSVFPAANNPAEMVTWFDCISYRNQGSLTANLQPVYVMTVSTYDGVHITDAASGTCDWTKKGYRLLTEAEWEYTCRSTSTTAFCNGPTTDTRCADPLLGLVGRGGVGRPVCGEGGSVTLYRAG
jgi:formylglycine-generating enzyme required for sulfatase activity